MITVCILAKNSAATLEETLESTRNFAEVLLLDNGSTDATLDIARRFSNVRIVEHPFIGFGRLRNKAAELASNEWILALDTDEVLSPPLLSELNALSLELKTIYSMPRENYYNGKHIKGCGWHPDRVLRLYNRRWTRYGDSQVHESLQIPPGGLEQTLSAPILHTPFRSAAEFLAKMQHYSTLFAQEHAGKKRSSCAKAFFHGAWAFVRSYLIQRGCLLGAEGFAVSLYNANSVIYKYLKLSEKNKQIDFITNLK